VDLDDLFREGAAREDGVVLKAQLRFRVHPPRHRAAQDLVDRLTAAYDERIGMICDEVDEVLQHTDSRLTRSDLPLVLMLGAAGTRSRAAELEKAIPQVYAPGAKGGKWYRDGQGHVRYGEKPQATFKQKATPEDKAPHISHYRPSPFVGKYGSDKELTDYLVTNGGHGFTKGDLRFLGTWYGTSTKPGSLFDAFLDCAGLTRADLKDDLSKFRFGGQGLSYEEAVFEFFAAQASLFMGTESGTAEEKAEWERVLNDEIKPLLDSVFSKFEAIKGDEKFQDDYFSEPDRQRQRFLTNARRHEAKTRDLADKILSCADPSKLVTSVIDAMKMLGLFAKPSRVDAHAHAHDRPHLRGATMLDMRLFPEDDSRSPFADAHDKLAQLSASQLMLVFVAVELHRRWDPETRSYSDEDQKDIGFGNIGEEILETLADKSKRWGSAMPLITDHLDALVNRMVASLDPTRAT
jgi:hypothetical protein